MKDWKGNEIKIGDTISSYYYKHMFGGCKFQWILSHRFIVTPPSNNLTIPKTNESIGEIPINMVDSDWVLPQKHLMCLCIEGVSDNEQDFFEEYFKIKQ